MKLYAAALVLLFCNFSPLLKTIVATSEEDKNAEALRAKIVANARYDLPTDMDYIDEIVHGRRVKDTEKKRRQAGCMCVERFIDPHCGTDMKTYDNGCFFMCAQHRTPGLRLKRWGDCNPQEAVYKEIN